MEVVGHVTSNAAVEIITCVGRRDYFYSSTVGRTALVPIRHMTQINRDSLAVAREICHSRYSLQGYL